MVYADHLRIYVSGRQRRKVVGSTIVGEMGAGLAVLRRDGFASLDSVGCARWSGAQCLQWSGDTTGTSVVTTHPVRFSGQFLFCNVAVDASGWFAVEMLKHDGTLIPGFSRHEANTSLAGEDRTSVAYTGGATER